MKNIRNIESSSVALFNERFPVGTVVKTKNKKNKLVDVEIVRPAIQLSDSRIMVTVTIFGLIPTSEVVSAGGVDNV